MSKPGIEAANRTIIETISRARIEWIDVLPAADVITFLRGRCLLHAGPPLGELPMCSAMWNAACGAAVYEGWAPDLAQAERDIRAGRIAFASAHEHSALGPMAGIISPSMPVLLLRNAALGNTSYVTINEGLGRTLRFGANDPATIERLRWIEKSFSLMLKEAIQLSGPIDITAIMEQAVRRGDECHNRNKSATSLLFRKLAPWMVRTSFQKEEIAEALTFIDGNDHFFLNFSIAAVKATMEPAHAVAGASLVTCMAANGVEFGIKLAGCGGKWYTAPAVMAEGHYFEGFGPAQANPVMGDSYICETAGLGGVALAAAPNIVRFIGGTVEEAVQSTLEMYRITVAEHPRFQMPMLGFRGTPLGIDALRVVDSGICPMINTGIAHRDPGVGQIGAGRFRPPLECFREAIRDLGL